MSGKNCNCKCKCNSKSRCTTGFVVCENDITTYNYYENCRMLYQITLTKTSNVQHYTMPGDVIVYTFTVKNVGTTQISGPIVIKDDKLGVIQLGNVTLNPQQSYSQNISYTVTTTDLQSTSITNTATAEMYIGEVNCKLIRLRSNQVSVTVSNGNVDLAPFFGTPTAGSGNFSIPVHVGNVGITPGENTRFIVDIPTDITGLIVTSPYPYTISGNTLMYIIGTQNNNTVLDLGTITFTPTANKLYYWHGQSTTTSFESNLVNNHANVIVDNLLI